MGRFDGRHHVTHIPVIVVPWVIQRHHGQENPTLRSYEYYPLDDTPASNEEPTTRLEASGYTEMTAAQTVLPTTT